MTAAYTLLIGNKSYSSWSLRGWLLFKAFGIPFEERLTPMYSEEFKALWTEHAPAKSVPTLLVDENGARHVVSDSLAIAEYLAERHPDAGHWPSDPQARAAARCLAAEMHSSFGALRSNMPMNLKRSFPGRGRTPGVDADIERIFTLWRWARAGYGVGSPTTGRWLFGDRFSVADAFFTPVALRFETFDVSAPADLADYLKALQDAPGLAEWRDAAEKEVWVERRYDYD